MDTKNDRILLAHGSGGKLTHELIKTIFKKEFSNPILNISDDAAELNIKDYKRIAFTTDSFVINPLFFPGGDIGKLSVCGTINDLSMKGSIPIGISISAIIEEGLEIQLLKKIAHSAAKTAKLANVKIITGDTKVVEKGKADKIFITTTGIGYIKDNINISGTLAQPGDVVLINGTIGDHGIAVLAARNEFNIKSKIKSDCAPLSGLVNKILNICPDIHVLRDPTRGGLATSLNEIADSSNVGIIIEEERIPIKREVLSVCNLLGYDPLYIANEGKFIAILPEKFSNKVISLMKKDTYGRESAIIGKIINSPKGVWLKTSKGGLRPLLMLEGEVLPRIC